MNGRPIHYLRAFPGRRGAGLRPAGAATRQGRA
jgi:hypothetical protein